MLVLLACFRTYVMYTYTSLWWITNVLLCMKISWFWSLHIYYNIRVNFVIIKCQLCSYQVSTSFISIVICVRFYCQLCLYIVSTVFYIVSTLFLSCVKFVHI